ncbi:MAG TPA: hypothetical protein HA277_03875 [Methanosphaera sp.]|nr:hypothetical protein [Methanosphaera sp.]HII09343.1 hypothetical protein [Methanosphaera sp.]HIJ15521.1 hypothetical protein [Methanosphaera sp.]
MKTSKIIGKKVLDCEANEIGKVSDIDIDLKSNVINKVIINTGELSLRKVNYDVTPAMIAQVGDYILLKISNSELSSKKPDENPDVEIVDPSELEEKK